MKDAPFDIQIIHQKKCIFDIIRKKYVILTPEEWVRQNFLLFLIQEKKIPKALIAVEKLVLVGKLRKRFDILISFQNKCWMLVECKSQDVKLSKESLSQILSYNSTLKASYIVMTNGKEIMCYCTNSHQWLSELPPSPI